MDETSEPSTDLQALLAIREAENRALKQQVADLRRRARQLEAELSSLRHGERKDPTVIDLDSDSESESLGSPLSSVPDTIAVEDDIKDEPELPKKLVKKRSASPVLALLDDPDVKPKIEDMKPRFSKKPRLKVEVVIDSPLRRSRPSTKPRRIGSARTSLPSRLESPARASGSSHLVDEKEYPHLADDVDTHQQQGHDDPSSVQPTPEPILQEAVPDLPVEQEQGQVHQNEAARDVSASAEPVPVVKHEEDNEAILALAAETLALLPKVDVKKGLDFDTVTIQSRIDSVGRDPYPVTLEPSIRATWVHRGFMSDQYGGSSQDTFPAIGQENLDKHGLNDFFYLNLVYHPFGPREPGQPGLWFNAQPFEGQWGGEWRVFVRLRSAQWLYVGQYRLSTVAPLSKEEWLMQSNQVQKTWAREVLKQGWGRAVRYRVIFRRDHGREPTDDEENDAYGRNYRQHPYQNLTPNEIINAYNSGKERIGVNAMKCVGYDERWQREIAAKFPTWVPLPKDPKREKNKSSANKTERKSKKSKVGKSAKADEGGSDIEIVEEDEDGGFDEDEDDEDEDDEVQEIAPIYIPRGTRSRPRAA
ncbi:hypothetical protein EWM64_g7178 [Hericium alpestre]|uniref:DUF6697 domain-containing protein n=1 Tax=Hericium alpestre TaxID=135208 RepID=A0A4Y9ZRE4_9AGAM|nr:hypothetical protein EWM64_g7178 [Hericium alpestre]